MGRHASPFRRAIPLICPTCNWQTRRVPAGCEMEHIGPCSCFYGLCRKCGGWMHDRGYWRRVQAEYRAWDLPPHPED
jgi:hypothetical protein